MDMQNIIGDYNLFILNLINKTSSLGIDIKKYPIDHLGYRVETDQGYKIKKGEIISLSKAFVENIYNGRPISKFLLKEPILIDKYKIELIELPSVKKEKTYPTGLEHMEVVIGDDFGSFKEKYKNIFTGVDNLGEINETLFITFDDNKTIKFHRLSLVEIIKYEGNKFTYL